MSSDINEIRHEIAKYARQKDKREVSFGPEEPSKWWPGTVRDPEGGNPFTHAGAWEFIADEVEQKETIINPKLLDKPCGKLGYEILINTKYGTVYVKVRLDKHKIIGRSFHYSGKG